MATTEGQNNNEIEIYVPSRYTGQGFFYLSKKHLLSASYIQQNVEQQIPMFTIMQQPPLAPLRFGLSTLMPKVMDLVPRQARLENTVPVYSPEKCQALQKRKDYRQVTAAIPISFLPLQSDEVDAVRRDYMGLACHLENRQASQKRKDYGEVIPAIPLSYIPPLNSEVNAVGNEMLQIVSYGDQEAFYTATTCEFSLSERKRDWLEEFRTRESPSARTDKYYYFVKSSSIMFRSLNEVYNFIAYGAMPKRNVKRRKENPEQQPADSSSRRIRGSTLVSKTQVGYYDPANNVVRRMAITGNYVITEMGYLKMVQDWKTDPMHPNLASFLQRYPNAVIPLYDFELLQ